MVAVLISGLVRVSDRHWRWRLSALLSRPSKRLFSALYVQQTDPQGNRQNASVSGLARNSCGNNPPPGI